LQQNIENHELKKKEQLGIYLLHETKGSSPFQTGEAVGVPVVTDCTFSGDFVGDREGLRVGLKVG
jgi:hypothetical protein